MMIHSDGSRCDDKITEDGVGRPVFCHHGLRVYEQTAEELR
jgi:hypothetical protein